MKAILRSINNFSCKLKQSNNLKYNISPKIRSNKFKSISGNGNVTIEDALNKDLKDYKMYGNTYQNSTSGKNKFDINQNVTYKSTRISCNVVNDDIVLTALTDYNGNAYCVKPIPNSSSLLGQTVTLSGNMQRSSQGTFRIIIGFLNSNGTYVSDLGSATAVTVDGQHKTFSIPNTFPTGATQIGLLIYFSRTEDTSLHQGDTVTYSNIQLEIGSNKTSYEPYTGGQPSPNPDYPQEIVSCGDRTKNMITGLRNSTSNYINFYFDKDMAVNNMTVSGIFTYTISNFTIFLQTSFGNESLLTNQSCTQNEKFSFDIQLTDTQLENIVNSTITPSIQFYRSSQMSGIGYSEIMLRASDTTPEYEPYGKYKIPVNVRSENLFDKDNANVLNAYFGIDDNKDVITSTSNNRMIYIPCKPNTTYTILKSLSNQFSIGYTYVQPEVGVSVYGMLDGTKSSVRNDDINTIVHLSITTNQNAKYLVLRYTNTNNDTNSTWQEKLNVIQIVEGSTVPDKYIPYYNETTNIYLDEPLRKIDGYSDYIDFINGKVVRQLGEVILDGSETWNKNQTWSDYGPNANAYTSYKSTMPNAVSNAEAISSHFIRDLKAYSKDENGLFEFSTYPIFRISKDIASTVTDFKTWLSQNNVTVDYVLETPTEEDIELPNINLIEGKNIITIGTEVQGVFEAEYYSKEIIDISDYKYNLRKVED